MIGKIVNGDVIKLCAKSGEIECLTQDAGNRPEREVEYKSDSHGRQMFDRLRGLITPSDEGAMII